MSAASEQGIVIVYTGTSGSGRKTIAEQIGRELGIASVISYTSREPRSDETNGKDYYFISRAQFIEADINGEFFQTVELDNHFYGIKKADVKAALKANGIVYVVVNRYGANRFKYEFGENAVRISIYVNKQTVLERLHSKDASDKVIKQYMDHYLEEVSYCKDCEHVFENIELSETIEQVKKVILPLMPAQAK